MTNLQKKFSKIYDQHVEKIYRFVTLKVGSDATAEDLTAETFSRGWHAFREAERGNRDQIRNMEAFLYRIARNLVADFYREHSRRDTISAEEVEMADSKPGPDQEALKNSDAAQVKQALTTLKSEYQDVIIWRHVERKSTKEVAEKMEKSEEAVRVQLHRAMKQLKQKLNDN